MLSKYFSLTVCNISSSFQLMVCLFVFQNNANLFITHTHTHKSFQKAPQSFSVLLSCKTVQFSMTGAQESIWSYKKPIIFELKKTKNILFVVVQIFFIATDLLFYPLCAKSIVESLDSFWKNMYTICYLMQTYFVLWMFCQIL